MSAHFLAQCLSWFVGGALVVFTARRLCFVVAACLPPRPLAQERREPSILLVLAARNEAAIAASALRSIEQVRYPADKLDIALVDDASCDGTGKLFARWAATRERCRVVTVSRDVQQPGGKSRALAAGVAASPAADMIVVMDADFEMASDGLSLLVAGLSAPDVGAVSGFLQPRNAGQNIVARYAALESRLHQLVTSAAKDRLRLDPPTIGVWMVRRDALAAVGGFPDCPTGEDVQVASALTRHGWTTRFVSSVVATNAVAATLAEYWWQHLRWARDVYASGRGVSSVPGCDARASERLLSASGYADRFALAGGAALAALGAMPVEIVFVYAGTIILEIIVALRLDGERRAGEIMRVLAAVAGMFVVDVAATAAATVQTLAGIRRSWHRPDRTPGPVHASRAS
ncbi:MAG TPA: glycosyltransferase family 2 protein [Kiritimatiellia bacterium]|jgi:glycosyltransferase involved in cell wall biosynthesis